MGTKQDGESQGGEGVRDHERQEAGFQMTRGRLHLQKGAEAELEENQCEVEGQSGVIMQGFFPTDDGLNDSYCKNDQTVEKMFERLRGISGEAEESEGESGNCHNESADRGTLLQPGEYFPVICGAAGFSAAHPTGGESLFF